MKDSRSILIGMKDYQKSENSLFFFLKIEISTKRHKEKKLRSSGCQYQRNKKKVNKIAATVGVLRRKKHIEKVSKKGTHAVSLSVCLDSKKQTNKQNKTKSTNTAKSLLYYTDHIK